MTPKERAAMQQALEALGSYKQPIYSHAPIDAAITALREALAEQAEQEPVADKVLRLLEPFMPQDAALVAAHEREACAKVCEERADSYKYATDPWAHEHISEAKICAAAIRARGE